MIVFTSLGVIGVQMCEGRGERTHLQVVTLWPVDSVVLGSIHLQVFALTHVTSHTEPELLEHWSYGTESCSTILKFVK
jgi:hypothetical protein